MDTPTDLLFLFVCFGDSIGAGVGMPEVGKHFESGEVFPSLSVFVFLCLSLSICLFSSVCLSARASVALSHPNIALYS